LLATAIADFVFIVGRASLRVRRTIVATSSDSLRATRLQRGDFYFGSLLAHKPVHLLPTVGCFVLEIPSAIGKLNAF